MTLDEARRKTMSWLRNSTSCCYRGEGMDLDRPQCPEHTPKWIEADAQRRMADANRWMGWTNRLGDLLPGRSAVRAGRLLADAGYRNENGHPSPKAIAEDLAAWTEHHGYPVALWNVERIREALAAFSSL